jgi:hypothetical protein
VKIGYPMKIIRRPEDQPPKEAPAPLPTCQGDGLVEDLDPRILFDNARLADLMDLPSAPPA